MSNNAKILIKKCNETRVKGKPIFSDIDFYNPWCEIQQLYGNELYQAINIGLENTLIFKVRYCKLLEELFDKDKFTVIFNNRKYSIYATDFAKEYKKYVYIKCKLVN